MSSDMISPKQNTAKRAIILGLQKKTALASLFHALEPCQAAGFGSSCCSGLVGSKSKLMERESSERHRNPSKKPTGATAELRGRSCNNVFFFSFSLFANAGISEVVGCSGRVAALCLTVAFSGLELADSLCARSVPKRDTPTYEVCNQPTGNCGHS